MIMKLYCDGGIIGRRNPGDGVYWSVGRATGENGVDTEIVAKDGTYDFNTNNEAEYLALIDSILYAAKCKSNGEEISRVIIHSDSQLIVNQFNGNWKCGKPHLMKLLETAQSNSRWLKQLGVQLDVVWVKRNVNVKRLGH